MQKATTNCGKFPLETHRSRVYASTSGFFLSIDRPWIVGVSGFFQQSGNVTRDARRDFLRKLAGSTQIRRGDGVIDEVKHDVM